MDASHLLRAARRAAGLSQRALATRSGVAASVISSIESGTHVPKLSTLDRLLAAVDLELVAVPRRAEVDESWRSWLRASTTERLRGALGPERTAALVALGRGPFVLPPEVSVALWVPHAVLPEPLPLHVPLFVRTVEDSPLLVPHRGPWGLRGTLPVNTHHRHEVRAWPPDAPVLQDSEHGPALRAVGDLLHEQMLRDRAGRRRMAHRDTEPDREHWWLFNRPAYDRLRWLPQEVDRREWRLGGDPSLEAQLSRKNGPPAL